MDEDKRKLIGSKRRDLFKQRHKSLAGGFYACDLDFVWIQRRPPCILAVLDSKRPGERPTFSEVITYNSLLALGIPVFLVEYVGDSEVEELDRLTVFRYLGGDPYPPQSPSQSEHVAGPFSWEEFGKWQASFREQHQQA
uniref:Uncharacterized protein n=1 Tax=viral metagenome TaxID=1070528 RepID=A0A6M3LQF6_9ZZZZ